MTMIVLDAGHGGNDPGTHGNGLIEKQLTLTLTLQVAQQLKCDSNLDIRLTRRDDTFVALRERADIANRAGADYFVSLHHNAGGGTGFESYVFPGTSEGETGRKQNVLHTAIMDFLASYGLPDRGEKEANFAVLRETVMPAILLENLFLDSFKDTKLLKKPSFFHGLSNAITMGIQEAIN